eukprot:9331788-Lingulodinium_polyedra.AAC.1
MVPRRTMSSETTIQGPPSECGNRGVFHRFDATKTRGCDGPLELGQQQERNVSIARRQSRPNA